MLQTATEVEGFLETMYEMEDTQHLGLKISRVSAGQVVGMQS